MSEVYTPMYRDTRLGQRGEKWEKVGNWTQGEKRGRVSGVLSAPLPLLAQEDPHAGHDGVGSPPLDVCQEAVVGVLQRQQRVVQDHLVLVASQNGRHRRLADLAAAGGAGVLAEEALIGSVLLGAHDVHELLAGEGEVLAHDLLGAHARLLLLASEDLLHQLHAPAAPGARLRARLQIPK
eukprot:1184733-Prorocentrum_minimum.AAC.1